MLFAGHSATGFPLHPAPHYLARVAQRNNKILWLGKKNSQDVDRAAGEPIPLAG